MLNAAKNLATNVVNEPLSQNREDYGKHLSDFGYDETSYSLYRRINRCVFDNLVDFRKTGEDEPGATATGLEVLISWIIEGWREYIASGLSDKLSWEEFETLQEKFAESRILRERELNRRARANHERFTQKTEAGSEV